MMQTTPDTYGEPITTWHVMHIRGDALDAQDVNACYGIGAIDMALQAEPGAPTLEAYRIVEDYTSADALSTRDEQWRRNVYAVAVANPKDVWVAVPLEEQRRTPRFYD
jgi:hypothetical protein